jgi:hypothetical protein
VSSHFISAHYSPSHYESSHYGREVIIELPSEDVHPPGMGRRKQIMEEDEVIMAIIVAFLETKH